MSGQVIPFANNRVDALKSIGVIPRTPSPPQQSEDEDEDDDKDPEDMTEDEMRAELKRVRVSERTSQKRSYAYD
jgi:hypothetical protein